MIRVIVANKSMHRVLIDNGSLADIIFASAFDKMGIGREKLEPVSAHLLGFSGERVLSLRSTQLVLTLGNPPCKATTVKVPHCRCSLGVQYVTEQAFSQCFKGCPLRLSYDYQVPNIEGSRIGSRRPAGSQGMLLGVNKTEIRKKCPHG